MSEIMMLGSDDYSEPISFIKMYSDGTPMVKTEKFDEIAECADMILVRPKDLNDFMVAMALVDAINSAGGDIRNLVLPYVPGARQDRINRSGDVLFTIGFVADIINMNDFNSVKVFDPHSSATPRLINNVKVFDVDAILNTFWRGYSGIIAPDKGAKDRAEKAGSVMGLPVIYGSKTRDVSTGRLSGFDVEVEAGSHYLVVDDICDGGGTFLGLGEKIREQGAFADLYVSHGIFSRGTDELKKIYKNIYTTNSRDINDRNDVYILNIVERMIK